MGLFIGLLSLLIVIPLAVSIYVYMVRLRNNTNRKYLKRVLSKTIPLWLGAALLTIGISFIIGVFISLHAVSIVITAGWVVFVLIGMIVSRIEANKIREQSDAFFQNAK